MCTILSIDVGSTNFGWALWSRKKGFYAFGVLNLKTVKGKDPVEKMHSLHESNFFGRADVVLVERQMRSKFKEMVTAIRCFNWGRTHIVAPQSVKRHFTTSKLNHRKNKKAHMELAATFMSEEELARLAELKKKDDVCDAVVQARYWIEKNNI